MKNQSFTSMKMYEIINRITIQTFVEQEYIIYIMK